MNKWPLMAAGFAAALLCGCGKKSARKAETEWEEGDVLWEEEEEPTPAARARRTPLVVEEAEPEVEEPAEAEEAVEVEEVEAADDEGEAAEEDEGDL